MGCDIHYVVEKKMNGKWIGIFTEWPRGGFAGGRDYDFFAAIAGVRGTHQKHNNYPKFLPEGISELALQKIIAFGTDGHSHSWMTIRQFSEIALDVNPEKFDTEYKRKEPWETLFGMPCFENTSKDSIDDYRIVFWFDN